MHLKFQIYLEEPVVDQKENPLDYRKFNITQFPILAETILAVPASSAPVYSASQAKF